MPGFHLRAKAGCSPSCLFIAQPFPLMSASYPALLHAALFSHPTVSDDLFPTLGEIFRAYSTRSRDTSL